MFDQPILQIDMPAVTAFASTIIALLLQLWLCFKVKKIWIKILPVALLSVSTIGFYICCQAVGGWDGMVYFYFSFLSFILIFVCGIGWGVWAIVRNKNR